MTSAAHRRARLVSLRWRPFRLPLRHRFEAAHGALSDRLGVLIELRSSSGLVGIGEASPMPSLGDGTVEDVLGLLERHGPAFPQVPDKVLESLCSYPAAGSAALACGLETALLDLEGQRQGVPIARLLAERPARAVPVNAVVGLGGIDDSVAFASEAIEAGYGVLKFKVASGPLDGDVERIAGVRRAFPEVGIRLDANGAWTEAQAAEALEAFVPLGVELVEQPVRPTAVRALGRLRRRGAVRVAADETVSEPGALASVLAERGADYLVLKPMRLGGLRRSAEIARDASEAGIPSFVTTTFDSSVGTAAALQLAAALGTGRPADGLSTADHLADDLVSRPLRPRAGRLRLPSRPGLGVRVSPAALERLATRPWGEA